MTACAARARQTKTSGLLVVIGGVRRDAACKMVQGSRAGPPGPRSRRAQPRRSIQDAAHAGSAQTPGKMEKMARYTATRPQIQSDFMKQSAAASLPRRAPIFMDAGTRATPCRPRPRTARACAAPPSRRSAPPSPSTISMERSRRRTRAGACTRSTGWRAWRRSRQRLTNFTQRPLWSKGMTRGSSSRSGGSIPSGGSPFLARRAPRAGTRASSRSSSRRRPAPVPPRSRPGVCA